MVLIFLCLGWLVGLYLGRASCAFADPEFVSMGLGDQIGLGLGGLALLAGVASFLGRGDRRLWVTALAVGLGLLGAWRTVGLTDGEDPLSARAGEVVLHGTITDQPQPRDAALLFTLEVDDIWQEAGWEPLRSRVLVRTDRYGEWRYGDQVVARGALRPVGSASSAWAEQLARQGIHASIEYPRLGLAGRPEGVDPLRAIDGVRRRLEELCGLLLPEPQSSLLGGILVGARASMPAAFRDELNMTSTSHLVAVSGFNVTVVAGLAQLAALRYLSRRRAVLLAIAAVWGYSLLTGLPPSALRAALMGTFSLTAHLLGRGGDALSFLCLSAALMGGAEPSLLEDLGFQLSFLATAGLVLLEPVLRGWFGRLPGWLAGSLSVTLAAQLATLPVLVNSFHNLSLVAPLANLLVAPALPGLMVTGAVAVALGAVALPLGQLVAPLAWVYLSYLVETVSWTAKLPSASIPTGSLSTLALLFYYALLMAVALWPLPEVRPFRDGVVDRLRTVPRWVMVGTAALLLSLGGLAFSNRPDGRLHVYFLDVGHGDATLIRGPEGHYVLVDGGPSPSTLTSALGRRLGFLDRGLDAVVLTGYGETRMAGLVEAARRHPIGLVLQPGKPTGRAGRAWSELIQERGLAVVQAAAGQRIPLGEGAWLEVLWASDAEAEGEPALALRLVSGGVSMLLPGDLKPDAQAELAKALPMRVDLLRVPHHGAVGALQTSLLQTASPRVAVVSIAAGNRYGHPSDSTAESLQPATLFRTDRHGTVEVIIDPNGYELLTDR